MQCKSRRICPFIDSPFENCYVANPDSTVVELAIRYCGNEFEKCGIYRKRMLIGRLRKSGCGGGSDPGPENPEGPSAADSPDDAGSREKGGIGSGES